MRYGFQTVFAGAAEAAVVAVVAEASRAAPEDDPLGALLGRTRAAVLELLTHQHTTSEVAAELGISAASASEHTSTLRAAGLVATERNGKSVRHTCTPLGLRLAARGPVPVSPG